MFKKSFSKSFPYILEFYKCVVEKK